ncbi:MAG: TRAP transporter large permease [Firmicutes bacterium]|nr:TRAP transporter large permease [Bacillota bacterium]
MSPEMAGVAGLIALIVLMMLRVPVGIAMIAVSAVGSLYILRPASVFFTLGSNPFATASMYSLSVIPMFVLMGMFVALAGFGKDLYAFAHGLVGRFRGGLAMATVAASGMFSAVSGSAVATASTMASVALPEMRRFRYDEGLAAGCTAVGGTLGILIPPSSILVLYGVLTEEPIGRVLVAGIVPGIMTTLLLMTTAYLVARFKPELAPLAERREDEPDLWRALRRTWPIPTIFAISMGGIYQGVFTPTEAGAVGAFLCLLMGIITRRLSWSGALEATTRSVQITATIFLITIGGKLFGFFLALTRIPHHLTAFVEGLDVSPALTVAIIFAIYFALGAFMDEIAILVIMTPITYPIVTALGYDGIWFGVLTIMMLLTGLLTPPVGMICFVVASVSKTPLQTVFRSVTPFWITLIVAAALVIAFPSLALYLPGLMR